MLEILTLDYDRRVASYCATAKATYGWFLRKTAGAEQNLEIQRSLIRGKKAYSTLRQDLLRGCILPPLVLSVRGIEPALIRRLSPEAISDVATAVDLMADITPQIESLTADNVFIIDGLQRTNAIKQTAHELADAALENFLNHPVRFEIWLNIPFGAIAYRMLLLNAGQRPMPMKHQVEILSMSLKDDLSDIEGLEIFKRSDGRRRSKSGQFQLAMIAQAFQAWLQGVPNVDVGNVVLDQMLADTAVETLGTSLESKGDAASFHEFMTWLVAVDKALPEFSDFFGNETVILGIAAAVGDAERNSALKQGVQNGLVNMRRRAEEAPGLDPLGIEVFREVRRGLDPGKRNVGIATRELVFTAFQRYFITNGEVEMTRCWEFAASTSKA